MTGDIRPDRHALLELEALLDEIAALRDEGNAERFDHDARYRWVLHRLWIAADNEALAYTAAAGKAVRAEATWANLYDLRNHLAHSRLPDIDEALVRRFTWFRASPLRQAVQDHLRRRQPGRANCPEPRHPHDAGGHREPSTKSIWSPNVTADRVTGTR